MAALVVVRKLYLGCKSVIIWIGLKLRYNNSIKMGFINSIKGKFCLSIKNGGHVSVGKFLMIKGPVYFLCGENGKLTVGKNCFFNHNVSVTCEKSINIGNDVNIANNVVIVDHDHVMTKDGVLGETISDSIIIGNKAWIGANVTITKGVKVGNGSVIAAGAVLNKCVPDHELWGGVPAKYIKKL